jgi:hypothetical protein
VHVATVTSACESDATWYGEVHLHPASDELANRLRSFISFCEEWNERVDEKGTRASEFDAFADIIGEWRLLAPDGELVHWVRDAPVFFEGSEVSWCAAPSGPDHPRRPYR